MNLLKYIEQSEGKLLFVYRDFIQWVSHLVDDGVTSGPNQSEALVNFTKLNLKRMQRIDKTFRLNDELLAVLREGLPQQHWVVITEAWCGDSAQILPILNKMAEGAEGKINLTILLRDQNPQLIEAYHTNGSKSIPKLIATDLIGNELFSWGPRPAPAQKLLFNWKQDPQGRSWDDFERELHTWYSKDKGTTVQNEFIELFQKAANTVLSGAA